MCESFIFPFSTPRNGPEEPVRRLGFVRYSAPAIASFVMLNGITRCVRGIPQDADLLRTYYDHATDTLVQVFEHADFSKCPPSMPIEELDAPHMERLD